MESKKTALILLTEYLNLKPEFIPNNTSETQPTTLLELVRKSRFPKLVFCPRCGSFEIVKYGFYQFTQRYHCKTCNKYFNDLTSTIFSHCRILKKLLSYINCMLYSLTLKKSEALIGVSYVNLFYWRHKIIEAFKKDETQLSGIVQCSDSSINSSEKGNKKLFSREAHFRGNGNSVATLGSRDILLISLVDKQDNTKFLHIHSKIINARAISNTVIPFSKNTTHWYTSPSFVYTNFCKLHNLKHDYVIGFTAEKEVNIKKAHDNLITLKSWLNIFKGVATKYLNNYLAWFKTLIDICIKNKEFVYTSFLELLQF